jgi:signal transduction histidine kinase
VDAGLGLRGMHERAAALGGRLSVGPREEGGWSVHAMLPLGGGDRP